MYLVGLHNWKEQSSVHVEYMSGSTELVVKWNGPYPVPEDHPSKQ